MVVRRRFSSWVRSVSAVGFVATAQVSCGGGKSTGGGNQAVPNPNSQVESFVDSNHYETNLANGVGPSTAEKADRAHISAAAYGFSQETLRTRLRGLGADGSRIAPHADSQSATPGSHTPVALSAATQAAPVVLTNAQRVARIGAGIDEAMSQCAGRIWPGYSWANLSVFFTDRSAKKAWLWQGGAGGKGVISPISFSKVPIEHRYGLYSFGSNPQKPEIGLSLNDSVEINQIIYGSLARGDWLVDTGIHEAFHKFFQTRATWISVPTPQGKASRAVEYPLDPMPRYLRYMIADKLLAYLKKPNVALLGQARELLNTYLSQYSQEAAMIASTDQIEGTASYVETIGSAMTRDGCALSKLNLARKALNLAQNQHSILSAADSESYNIGAIAGLVLRSLPAHHGWEAKVAAGKTLLDVLLAGVKPQKVSMDAGVKNAVDSVVRDRNIEIGNLLAPFFSVQKDPNSVLVFLPDSLMIGAYSVDVFIQDLRSGMELDANFSSTFMSKGKSQANITLSGYTTVQTTSINGTPCMGSGRAAFVLPSAIAQSGQGLLSINLPEFQAQDAPFEKKSASGRVWYCLM